ncbi:MAG: carbohydrate ABC transporter, N-acetylglucosamine/diacetylchitobiose-binding protein [Tessaracoccus sp.]|uniref:N-acetylglucosamine/diacetylchitobiose ABC transporter substrate-binding protein n=1 Tax=Tessaracoccus sp. TaxID=1971211 RepID=UPI001ECF6B09|nr:N-acetylglucosamine/diacetylchitobiose ABC transporter substrate-binding protein [Tessaracoccus sp.]MBK7820096.1 carbohydrate ABC transporter, N-acetylglucosamine/diacetylchitobiose-binding protein [Tessaracoccus sp.]
MSAVGSVAACTRPPAPPVPPPSPSPSPTPTSWPSRPGDSTSIEAVVFDGAFGTAFVTAAGERLTARYPGLHVQVRPVTAVATELTPRFAADATPPDLIGNSGADALAVSTLLDELLPLDDFLATPEEAGTPLSDALFPVARAAGTVDNRQVALPYVLTVFGLWHSAHRLAAEGWTIPATWDGMLDLGERAQSTGTSLFVYGTDAADYYLELAISSAIKEGGHEVRVALDNLAERAWEHPAVLGVLRAIEECVKAGFVLSGGDYLKAQQEWTRKGRALLYPAGSWIVRETEPSTPADFELAAVPVPTLTSSPTLSPAAAHLTATEQFLVPSRAANTDGGLALLRELLTPEAAADFSRQNLVPTVVRNSVPSDLASSALTSQTRMIADAGDDVFSWRFTSHYGLSTDLTPLWARFLSGRLSAEGLAEQTQALTDKVRNDPAVERYTVS